MKDQYSSVPGRNIMINFEHTGKCLINANELVADIFSNLIWNAIKHSDPSKPIMININISETRENSAKYCLVAIEDNGPGIEDEIKSKLFHRFSRGKTNAKGSGLGLYLVKTLVESFHGNIKVEDRVQGDYSKGVRFVVMLPVADV